MQRLEMKRHNYYSDDYHRLVQDDSKDNDHQNNGEDKQQNTRLTPCAFLVVTRLLQVCVCTYRRIVRRLDILLNDIKLRSLLMHHMRDITEQLIELADRLLDVADLRFALDDHGLLKVDLVLVRQP
jgi:hypothetical protein